MGLKKLLKKAISKDPIGKKLIKLDPIGKKLVGGGKKSNPNTGIVPPNMRTGGAGQRSTAGGTASGGNQLNRILRTGGASQPTDTPAGRRKRNASARIGARLGRFTD